MDKNQQVKKLIHKLKRIASTTLEKKDINTSLAALSFAAETLYMFNQFYTDDELEELTTQVGDEIKAKYHFAKCKTIDFD